MDSQSVKTTYQADHCGFHGGKKIKGRGRQIAVDSAGLLWGAHVHAANGSDTIEGCVLADRILSELPSVRGLCADQGYRGTFVDYIQLEWGCLVDIPQRAGKAFQLDPKRWVVERTFAWNNGARRLSKDYETHLAHSEAMLYIAAISRTIRHLAFN